MPLTIKNIQQIVRPWRLYVFILIAVFTIEAAVMLVLPWVLPPDSHFLFEAILDALLLTAILAPLLWRYIIHPLQVLVTLRTQLLRRLLTAQEVERGRIARDLHDGLGQSLTCLLVGLRAAQELSTEESVRSHLEELRRVGGSVHDELRRLSRGLRPTVLDDVGLAAALERMCEDASASSGCEITCVVNDTPRKRLPPHVETTCFRIVQEAITNALRHGRAKSIGVVLHVANDAVSIVVCNAADDSPAELPAQPAHDSSAELNFGSLRKANAPPVPPEAFRLWTIRERVQLLDGVVDVESRDDGSTCVTCRIPLEYEEAANGEDSRFSC